MDENEIIEALATFLRARGYFVRQRLLTTERGVDLIAQRAEDGPKLWVEAKGGTSSRSGSNRFGKPFTEGQVLDRVSKGFYAVAKLRSEHPRPDEVALVTPDTHWFRKHISAVSSIAAELSITLWVVQRDHGIIELRHDLTSGKLS